jgi:tRNA(Arg) A34 adenosine deaminase TadA
MNGAWTAGTGDHQQFMRIALTMAERGMAAGGAPVGACLVRDGNVVARAQNAVVAHVDITAHAEVEVIRLACRDAQSLSLAECCLYVTVEPCAMCIAASHYAGIREIVFGADIAVMNQFTHNELTAADFGAGMAAPALTGGVLAEECAALVRQWGGMQ